MSISPEQFQVVAAGMLRMEESMKHMVKSEDIKVAVTEAVEEVTKKLGERQDQIETQFKDLKSEFGKLMEEMRAGAPSHHASQNGASSKRRATSSGPTPHEEERSSTVVIKNFPYPMWRRRIIDIGETLIKPRLPSSAKFKCNAMDNTKFLKVTFEQHKDAVALIESCRATHLVFTIGDSLHELRVGWDKSPEDRTKGWVISQLWSAIDEYAAGKAFSMKWDAGPPKGRFLRVWEKTELRRYCSLSARMACRRSLIQML